MKRILFLVILLIVAIGNTFAAYELTASKVTIEDVTVDKNNFFVSVEASTSSGEYTVGFDVWPSTHSAIGTFSAADKTITYVSCFVHKTQANGNAVNMWYYPADTAEIFLSIVSKGNGKCTLSGSIEAVSAQNGETYTYNIAAFDFDYSEEDTPEPPAEDPFRFEPTTPTTISFVADVVNFRDKTDYIEVTLNEMANETYDWVELRLLSDTLDMPAGTYTIDDSGLPGSLSASRGYLGSQNDDPCYVAIREDKENWGQYTPYYLESGLLTVAFNAKGDTISISGDAVSHNGSVIHISARSYNMLYVPEEPTPEPEDVTLAIDTVVVTYLSDQSDSTANRYRYTMDFSASDEFPNVLVDVIMNRPMELVAGTYTLADSSLIGLNLFQNQSDFNSVFFGGEPYVFETAALTLTPADATAWRFNMLITDTIGSQYHFELVQDPHIIFYPIPVDTTAQKDKPYADEQKETATVTIALDSIDWKSNTVSKDGILDIVLTQHEADINGLRAYVHLGMYTSEEKPAAGTYPVESSENEGTFSASLGRYGNTLIPCYVTLMDDNGWAHAVWYIVSGTISLSYDERNQPVIAGDCTSYFGSTIRFAYPAGEQALPEIEEKQKQNGQKVLRNGQLLLLRNGTTYTILGQKIN